MKVHILEETLMQKYMHLTIEKLMLKHQSQLSKKNQYVVDKPLQLLKMPTLYRQEENYLAMF
jgi:hypothetical protein